MAIVDFVFTFLDHIVCPGSYRCEDSMSCIRFPSVCDGIIDCIHGDDERDQQCGRAITLLNWFLKPAQEVYSI